MTELQKRVRAFTGEQRVVPCSHDHKLQGTGVFYQSAGLIQCATCKGWQMIRKPIE